MANDIVLDGIVLPVDLEWEDEFAWPAVSQKLKRTVTNQLVRVEQQLVGGRPITLVAGDNSGWVPKPVADALYAIYTIPYGVFTFNFRDRFTAEVCFRHADVPALELKYIVGGKSPNDWLLGQIKLMTTEV